MRQRDEWESLAPVADKLGPNIAHRSDHSGHKTERAHTTTGRHHDALIRSEILADGHPHCVLLPN